jgi:hypothetical protein
VTMIWHQWVSKDWRRQPKTDLHVISFWRTYANEEEEKHFRRKRVEWYNVSQWVLIKLLGVISGFIHPAAVKSPQMKLWHTNVANKPKT